MVKDPAEKEREKRRQRLHLPRNVTRTNYTSRDLPERICVRVPYKRAQTHILEPFSFPVQEKRGEGRKRGSFPPRVIRSYVARARGRSTSGVEGEKEARRSIPPDDSADLMRLDLRNRRIAPSKTSGISSLSSLLLDPHDRRLPREDSFSRLGLQNPARRGFTTDSGALYPCDPRRTTRPGE